MHSMENRCDFKIAQSRVRTVRVRIVSTLGTPKGMTYILDASGSFEGLGSPILRNSFIEIILSLVLIMW